ncbi:MAG: methylglyoxal synthase [Hyphomicrobiales bacterium]
MSSALDIKKHIAKGAKRIGLVAHDNRKKDLLEWVEYNYKSLIDHQIICTGTTGKLVEELLLSKLESGESMRYDILKLKSGPLGGDQQLGALISEGYIDIFIFLWDPMTPQPHEVDVKALLRIAVLYNVPTADNRSTADFLISSPFFHGVYEPMVKGYDQYLKRDI